MRALINGIPLLTPLSGVGRYVHSLAASMGRLAPEDRFFFFYNGYWSSKLKGQPSPTVQAARHMGRRFGSLYTASRMALDGAFQLTHHFGRFDLYHETCFVPFRFNGPTVVTVLDLSFHHFPETHPPERLRFLRKFFYSRLNQASHFITISEFVRNEMVQVLGLPPDKISVTYPGVDGVFHPREPETLAVLRTRYGVEPGKFLLFVGSAEPRKNIPLLLQAYSLLSPLLRREFPLVLAGGGGWMQGGLSDLVGRLGISDNVKRLGYVPFSDLPLLYAGAAIFVYPSMYEGFGLPPVEAMASGCPVLVSNGGSLPEVVGEAAVTVDPQNSELFSRSMERILEDPVFRLEKRGAGLLKAREYRWDRCAQSTLDVYHRFGNSVGSFLGDWGTGTRVGFRHHLCPACEQTASFNDVERWRGFLIVRCGVCGLEFSDPMRAGDASWYDDSYVVRHQIIDNRVRSYYRWAVRHLPGKGRLLDVGCGAGVFVNFARQKGFEAYGLDFSEEAISLGKAWYKLNCFFLGSPRGLLEREKLKKFDAVTFFEVLEHTENPADFLEEIKSVLNEGGSVAISVPFRDRWPLREKIDYPPHHLTRWTSDALRRLFERCGFEVQRVELTSRFRSFWQFLGYFLRVAFYAVLGIPVMPGPPSASRLGHRWLKNRFVGKGLSILRLRQVRDGLMIVPALVFYPFFFRKFQGSNITLLAKKR